MTQSSRFHLSTKALVLASFFVGINIVLSRVGAIMLFNSSVRLSFGNIPLILSGLLLGPAAGLMTGVVSDILGFLINSHGGAYHPGFTLSAGLTGLIPGLIMVWSLRNGKSRFSLSNVILANILIYLLISGLLNTYLVDTFTWHRVLGALSSSACQSWDYHCYQHSLDLCADKKFSTFKPGA
jgi:riboflavin transporter